MYTAQASVSHAFSYDFQRDFSGIARPGMNRYLRHLGYDPDAPADGLDDCWRAGLDYIRELWRVLQRNQRHYHDYGHAEDLRIYGFKDWTRESVAAYVEARLSDMIDTDEAPPVDLYKAVYLGTELARERELDVGPEAIAYAADRLKSKIERDAVCDSASEVLDGFQSYAFRKEVHRRRSELAGHVPGDEKIVYVDFYKRQRERAEAKRERADGPKQGEQEAPKQERPKQEEAEPDAKADAHAKAVWKPKPWTWQDPKTLPRLESLYGGHYYRGEVVSTVAPGGVGKSMHSIVEALAMITGKPLLGEPSRGGLRVMLCNYEDSDLVLRHRVTAAMLHYKIRPEEIAGRLFVESMDSDLMCFAKVKRDGVEIIKPSVGALVDAIRDNGIDVVIIDPWVSVHQVDGNLSHLVQPIVTVFKITAQATNTAIEIVAHSRKPNGRELTEEDALGSVAFVNKTRDVRVLNKMAEADATKYGLAPWEAGDYFRVDTPKHTHRRSVKPVWRQKISVSLGNRGPGLLDFATQVGVVAEWSPPSPQSLIDGLDPAQITAIKKAVSDGLDRESPQATNWAGKAVAKVLGLDVVDRGQKAKAKITLLALVNAGHFEVEERPNPDAHGRTCKHLVPADPEAEEGAV